MPAETLLTRALAQAGASACLARAGVRIDDAAGGKARTDLFYTPSNANRSGAVHGGALATLLLTTAELAAASSERDSGDAVLRTSTAAISFLGAVHENEDVTAEARVVGRGRDTVHVAADASRAGKPVAAALVAYSVLRAQRSYEALQPSRAAAHVRGQRGQLAGSAYMGGAGAHVVEAGGGWACMTLPMALNEAAPGRVHDGAMLGLVDTCAALAAFGGAGGAERPPSATITLSAAWAGALDGDLIAGARLLGRASGTYTCEAEVWSAADRLIRASSLICYRIAGVS